MPRKERLGTLPISCSLLGLDELGEGIFVFQYLIPSSESQDSASLLSSPMVGTAQAM